MDNKVIIKRNIILALLALVIVIALAVLTYNIANNIMAAKANDVLRTVAYSTDATIETEDVSSTESTVIPEETEEERPSVEVVYDSPINFVALQSINPDIYSWIEIPDTVISYAVLQNRDDWRYYLNHTFDNQYNTNGAIFSQNIQRHNYRDYITILYGHNLINREMFGSLREYRSESYMREHQNITIYTPTEELTYEVFAAVTFSNDLITNNYDVKSSEGLQAFLDDVYALEGVNNVILDDVEVTCEDHVLVLSTCNGNPSQRQLVLAVLREE